MSKGSLSLIKTSLHTRSRAISWLAGEGSNLQPPDPKSGVLPVELPANQHKDPRWNEHVLCLGYFMFCIISTRDFGIIDAYQPDF